MQRSFSRNPMRVLYECGYGYRKCSAYRCMGFPENERCNQDPDCNPGLYCDANKRCVAVKSQDDPCDSVGSA